MSDETPLELFWRLIREGYTYQKAIRHQLLAEQLVELDRKVRAERNRQIIARGGQP